MTETGETADKARQGFPWLKALLIASLALNLLLVGGAAARFFMHERPDRISGISQMQLVPRRFFGDLERPRRMELLAIFKNFRDEFRDGRKVAREQTAKLATALEAEPYDPAAVTAVVDGFSRSSSDLIGLGGRAALTFIAKLTPQERLLLARHLRQRDDGGRHMDHKPGGDDD